MPRLSGECRLFPVVSGPRAESVLIPGPLWSRPFLNRSRPIDVVRAGAGRAMAPCGAADGSRRLPEAALSGCAAGGAERVPLPGACCRPAGRAGVLDGRRCSGAGGTCRRRGEPDDMVPGRTGLRCTCRVPRVCLQRVLGLCAGSRVHGGGAGPGSPAFGGGDRGEWFGVPQVRVSECGPGYPWSRVSLCASAAPELRGAYSVLLGAVPGQSPASPLSSPWLPVKRPPG